MKEGRSSRNRVTKFEMRNLRDTTRIDELRWARA